MDCFSTSPQEQEKRALADTTDSPSWTSALALTEAHTMSSLSAGSGNGNINPYLFPIRFASNSTITPVLSGHIPDPPTMNPSLEFADMVSTSLEDFTSYDHYQLSQRSGGWPIKSTTSSFYNVPPQQGVTMNPSPKSTSFPNDPAYYLPQPSASTIQIQLSALSSSHAHPEGLQCKWEGCRARTTFRRANDLIRHIRTIHVAPHEYRCPVEGCGMAFGREDHLRAHEGVHLRRG
ncbi:hypothetical protein ASPCAL08933 [Aspergillus calidoustus]|uniref:C2H2-type domain-containing protein n=1 Tax=Aspergillus calidoustus TaxID=454130 RepID=A0A0U5HL31_ASPCI|nr:hypothetical protein ASPCAL08933 [Aspergillus calidoustus]